MKEASFPFFDKIPQKVKHPMLALTTLTGLAVGGAACQEDPPQTPVESPKVERPLKSSEIELELSYSKTFPFAPGETWWYTAGPHYDGLSDGVPYAVDYSPTEMVIPCPGGGTYEGKFVRAIANGVVTISGRGSKRADQDHSIVEIDHGEGFSAGFIHLDDIRVDVGQEIKQGDPLGYASCEVSPGGSTNGVHVHQYAKFKGEPIEIDRLTQSGWAIEAASTNKNGFLTKSGEQTRTAEAARCGPTEESIKLCRGFRNDISWGNIELEKAPTIPLAPTIAPVETVPPVGTSGRKPFPDTDCKYLDGREVDISAYRGKVVLVFGFYRPDGVSRRSIGWVSDIEKSNRDRLAVLTFIEDFYPEETVAQLSPEINTRFVTCDESETFNAYCQGFPFVGLIDKSGRVVPIDVPENNQFDMDANCGNMMQPDFKRKLDIVLAE